MGFPALLCQGSVVGEPHLALVCFRLHLRELSSQTVFSYAKKRVRICLDIPTAVHLLFQTVMNAVGSSHLSTASPAE